MFPYLYWITLQSFLLLALKSLETSLSSVGLAVPPTGCKLSICFQKLSLRILQLTFLLTWVSYL